MFYSFLSTCSVHLHSAHEELWKRKETILTEREGVGGWRCRGSGSAAPAVGALVGACVGKNPGDVPL